MRNNVSRKMVEQHLENTENKSKTQSRIQYPKKNCLKAKYFFCKHKEAYRIHHQWACTIKSVKGSPLD